jgi:hypothetical protein
MGREAGKNVCRLAYRYFRCHLSVGDIEEPRTPEIDRVPAKEPTMKTLRFLTHQEIFDRAARHLFSQGHAGLLPRGVRAYRGYCGGCPVGNFIAPRDYITAMEGVPVLFIGASALAAPSYMDVGVTALKRALLRSQINVYDPVTIELLSYLQNVHDVFDKRQWRDGLASVARQFGLCADLLEHAA